MKKAVDKLTPCFVELIPEVLDHRVLCISIECTTTTHRYACGCGEKVVLSLHPID